MSTDGSGGERGMAEEVLALIEHHGIRWGTSDENAQDSLHRSPRRA